MANVGTSSRSGANTDRERETFDCLAADIGHDPARWLDWDFLANDDAREIARSVIRGLKDVKTVRAWLAVERALERTPPHENDDDSEDEEETHGREQVVAWLEERQATLEERGCHDFEEWLADNRRPSPEPTESQVELEREQPDGSVELVDPSVRDQPSSRSTSLVPEGEA